MRGLYLHIPFCQKKCFYCNFVISVKHQRENRRLLTECLRKEITEVKKRFGSRPFDTLYFGGGTPSILDTDEFESLMELLREEFDLSSLSEVTLEMNPGDGDSAKFRLYRRLGVNRVSLGAQSFDDDLLKSIGRWHTAEDNRTTFKTLRDAGFGNISLDLIFRLPGQSLKQVEQSLEAAVSLNPEQVTIYDLEVHPETSFGVWEKQHRLHLPDESLHEQMLVLTEEMLAGKGYDHYELLSYAKPGFESAHNMIYWRNEEYLGLGPGAFSYADGIRYQLAGSVEDYFQKCRNADWNFERWDVLSDREKETESLLTGLRLKKGIRIEHFPLIGVELKRKFEIFKKGGLLNESQPGCFCLTQRGRFLFESILQELVGERE